MDSQPETICGELFGSGHLGKVARFGLLGKGHNQVARTALLVEAPVCVPALPGSTFGEVLDDTDGIFQDTASLRVELRDCEGIARHLAVDRAGKDVCEPVCPTRFGGADEL